MKIISSSGACKRGGSIAAGLASVALFAGCVGTGPNTQRGAVAGGTLGAIAGAILGNNSRGGDALGGAILGATAGAMAGGALGNATDAEQGTLYTPDYGYAYPRRQPAYAGAVYDRPVPAPPSRPDELIPPAPASTAIWITGYWAWDGRSYRWTPGLWEIPPPNAHAYVAAHWERSGPGFVFVRSYWQ